MRTISFLVTFCLVTTLAAAYTVVLKSGKTVEGELIGEDSSTIQLREENGFILSFRKSTLDLSAMSTRNRLPESRNQNPREWVMVQGSRIDTRTLVEVADECRKNRTGKGRVLTFQDLAKAPELSIIGSDSGSIESPAVPARQDEQFWRKSAAALKKEIATLREKRISAESVCNRARERNSTKLGTTHENVIDLSALFQEPPECNRLREVDRRLVETQDRLEDFEERARKSEVPWQWLH